MSYHEPSFISTIEHGEGITFLIVREALQSNFFKDVMSKMVLLIRKFGVMIRKIHMKRGKRAVFSLEMMF